MVLFGLLAGTVAFPAAAQNGRRNPPPDRPQARQERAPRQVERPPQRPLMREREHQSQRPPMREQERPPQRPQQRPPERQPERQIEPPPRPQVQQGRNDRPPRTAPSNPERNSNFDRPGANAPRAAVPPRYLERLQDMRPEAQQQFLQNNQHFQNMSPQDQQKIRDNLQRWNRLTPQQRQDAREREQVWRQLTPEQQQHIRNDVMPKWNQLSPGRKQAIGQKLRVLQNMPESARNQRLNDPNFTRGMSESDKAMLRDLSHLHVGGPPDAPGNE